MLEKRFQRNPAHQEAYTAFMQEYIDLGHMEVVKSSAETTGPVVYIPHHFVTKADSSTTKLRVVFDASMKSTSGIALNDALMVGPTIQDELLALLIRFRLHPIAIKGDIAKMYRQFEVHPSDRDLQRILWRSSSNVPVQEYQLKTVTYGTACAPYLATKSLYQLANDEKFNYPQASEILIRDSYVDDLISGASDTTGAVQLVKQLINLTASGGMEMRKWCSNSPEVMSSVPAELRETGSSLSFDNHAIKALGIRWEPQKDVFKFDVRAPTPRQHNLRKNELLGEIARTFDPMGWLTPITIRAKLLFQSLWKDNKEWSDFISDDLQQQWNSYQQELQEIHRLEIPRCVVPNSTTEIEVHGFCDASEKAYSAAVYLKSRSSNQTIISHLLMSKTKIAPLKKRSIPRLELCGALLLAELITYVKAAIHVPCSIFAWTDSMVVLHWLNSESRRWKTFVANRVADIQELIPAQHWRHVRSEENPADLPSKGMPVSEIMKSTLWWYGPSWLASNNYPDPLKPIVPDATEVLEELPVQQVVLAARSKLNSDLINRLFSVSSLDKLIQYVAWIRRIITFLHLKRQLPAKGPITPVERKAAFVKLIQLVQHDAFGEDISKLKNQKPISSSSPLLKFTPFLDADGTLRVGGRLEKSAEREGKVHPIIIPKSNPFTELVIRNCHINLLHGGPTLVLCQLRRTFWIINGRNEVRKIIAQCVKCKRVKAVTAQQLMGALPTPRVTASRPFSHCGVDLAGPFLVKTRRGRGSVGEKCWMVIFVCFSTKAVHLDAVLDLSTDSFIAAFTRFSSRRGISSHIYSDCGTNFIGANRTLTEIQSFSVEKVQQQTAAVGTTWVFNPPSAPHQGGLWEAGVKSAKNHLKRIMGDRLLTYEQFVTLLCSVEACLNSRPLCPLSSDPLDMNALTPGHFLIGQPLVAVPEPALEGVKTNRLSYWQDAQQMSQHFWRRWKDEYLSNLHQRSKWQRKEKNVRVGDLVVIREDNIPPTKWRLGRVVQVFPGSDQLVRKATVKTPAGEVTRPINKLSVLLKDETE